MSVFAASDETEAPCERCKRRDRKMPQVLRQFKATNRKTGAEEWLTESICIICATKELDLRWKGRTSADPVGHVVCVAAHNGFRLDRIGRCSFCGVRDSKGDRAGSCGGFGRTETHSFHLIRWECQKCRSVRIATGARSAVPVKKADCGGLEVK